MKARDRLRRWLGIDAAARETAEEAVKVSRSLTVLNRQVAELRGLVGQQANVTVEALRRAGWQTDEEAKQQGWLKGAFRAIRGEGDVIAGPWTGEVGFELLYWIPFLTWLTEQGLDGRRLVIISRGGAAPWYRHLTSRYIDILDLVTPDDFRESTAGPKKQFDKRRSVDQDLVTSAKAKLNLHDATVVHPSAMFRLFAPLWRKQSTVELVEAFTTYRMLNAPPALSSDERPKDLPADYMVAKFYFSKAFPDSTENRAFITDLLGKVSTQVPVALMSTATRLDEHRDFRAASSFGSGLYIIDPHTVPQRNLERQTQLICGGRGFIGTYGGFSYLAPFYGVRSLSFFSRRFGFESHHLELANRVFDRLLPGGFLALDRRAIDLIDPAVTRWTRQTGGSTKDGQTGEADVVAANALT